MARPRRLLPALFLAVALLLSACGSQHTSTGATTAAQTTTAAIAASSAATTVVASTTARTPTEAISVPTSVAQSASSTIASSTKAAASAAPAPTATPNPILPTRLDIPAIGVNAPVEEVGLTPDGAMDVPKQWNDVAWYEYGPVPGQAGNAAIAGHLDSTTAPAVFWRLGALKPGDKLTVTLSDAKTVTFEVKETVSYPYDNAPIDKIFGPATTANLNLITCGGSWDAQTKNYSNRIVVYATKVG